MPVSVGFRFIKPRRSFLDLGRRTESALQERARQVASEIRADFEKTTATWEHQVEFVEKITFGARGIDISVSTDDEIYKFVNSGTKPHAIVPVRARALRFRGGYKAKTTPGVLGSSAGGSSGPEVTRKAVWHPGTEARNFDLEIHERWYTSRRFKTEMQDAVRQGVLGW